MSIEVRRLGPGDESTVHAAAHLFDDEPDVDATARFLGSATSHLLVAYLDGTPAGFVSGVELTHPDKGTEMLLYELGVDEAHRGKGVATVLVAALADEARTRGCYGMWVLTEESNAAAHATYARAGGVPSDAGTMFSWSFLEP